MSNHPLVSILLRTSNRRKRARELVISSATGIVEQQFVPIGDIEQWISIRGEDRNNPILLFVHGGPASPYSVFIPVLRPWERYFTVVQWDQRGAGKTWRKNGRVGTGALSFERLAQDAIEVVEYLCQHLAKEQVILVGSSVGSFIGVMVARRRPDLLSAYVGTDQNGPGALERSYQLTLGWLREAGNRKGVKAAETIWRNAPHWTPRDLNHLHQWMLKAGEAQGIPSFATTIMLPAMMSSPNHTLGEIRDIASGMKFSLDMLFHELLAFDIQRLGLSFDVPFFVFQGDSDVFAPVASAKAYFDEVQAPHKEFVLIERSGHLAAFTRPEQFLQELLLRVRPLAITPANEPAAYQGAREN
jgi:pimeloyl-ACP methyl ester carboxylesterase